MEAAFQKLMEAGWYPDRKVSIEPFIAVLEEEGYEVFPKAREFLAQFGD